MKRNICKRIFSLILTVVLLISLSSVCFSASEDGITATEAFVNTVLKYGRYIEGSEYPELFVDGFNVDTNKPVEWKWEGKTYNPANFFNQQNFLRTLVGLSELTGNSEYKEIAKKQVKLWFDKLTDNNGLVYTGAHTFVDVKTGEVVTTGDHEMKDNTPFYELMYEVDPESTIKYMEAFWNAHILDWSNLNMNRHGQYNKEMSSLWDNEYTDTSIDINSGEAHSFQSTGNDLIAFAFFISEKTEDERPEQWALRLLQKYIDVTNSTTGLSGAQYGEMESGDRAFKQFGEEFGEIAKEYNYVNKNKIDITAGYAPKVLLPYYERTKNEDVLDYVVKTIEGVATYAYDAETNTLKTPMWSDGTSLQGYTLQRNGEYGNKGETLPEYENVSAILLTSAIYAHKVSKSEKIWEFARNLAKGFGLGDIGTAPGVGVALSSTVVNYDSELVSAMLDLYEQTGCQSYLDLAEKIGNNLLKRRVNNMFLMSTKYVNAKINSTFPLALLRIEAAKQGKFDAIPDGETSFGIDIYYDGMGRVSENTVIYRKESVAAQSICVKDESITLPLKNSVAFNDISAHDAEKEIKQMASKGIVSGRTDTSFMPDAHITRGELIEYCARLCSLSGIEGTKEAGLIDSNLEKNGSISPDAYITTEEMASVLAKALIYKLPENNYKECGALSRFKDSADISTWAKTYCDIAANNYLIGKRGEEYFNPKSNVTRAEAVISLKKLCDLIGNDAKKLEVTIEPADAAAKTVTYTSSDNNVIEVDASGRLYPLKAGTAVITAKCDDVEDVCEISVIPFEEYMLKSIKINGEEIDGFSPMTRKYNVDLLIGTTQMPVISAASYSGDKVTVLMPETIPGVAKVFVEGNSEKAYTIGLTAKRINYTVNENFETMQLDTVPHSVLSDRATWWLNSNGWINGSAPVKIAEYPSGINTGQAVAIPYIGDAAQLSARFYESPIITGESAEENSYIFIEYDLMTTAPLDGLSVQLGYRDSTLEKNIWAIKQTYGENSITLNEQNTAVVGEYSPNEIHSVKMVINKKTMESDIYFNGEKVLTGQKALTVTGQIDTLLFNAYAGLSAEATVYVDNVKIYEMPIINQEKSAFYKVNNTLDESFEELDIDTALHKKTSDNVTWWLKGESATVENHPSKNNADKAVAIPYKNSLTQFSARFYESPIITGESAEENSYIFIEYDLMTTAPLDGLSVQLGYRDSTQGKNIWAIKQTYGENSITLNEQNTAVVGEYSPNEIHSVKMVINKKTMESDIYFNGEKVLTGQKALTVTGQIDTLLFNAYAGINTEATIYVDNIKIKELSNEEIDLITDENEIGFSFDIQEDSETDVDVICAIRSSNGVLKQVTMSEDRISVIHPNHLSSLINVDNMDEGDVVCVYVWTKELCPLMKQKFVYKF